MDYQKVTQCKNTTITSFAENNNQVTPSEQKHIAQHIFYSEQENLQNSRVTHPLKAQTSLVYKGY